MALELSGHIRDILQLFINGKMVNKKIVSTVDIATNKFGSFGALDSTFTVNLDGVPIPEGQVEACVPQCTVDFFVENLGRVNFGKPHHFNQKKGLWEGDVLIDDVPLKDWTIIPLEFKNSWVQK